MVDDAPGIDTTGSEDSNQATDTTVDEAGRGAEISAEAKEKALMRLADIAEVYVESQTVAARGALRSYLILTIVLALLIVAPVSFLSWQGKLSSDAIAFLWGVIVTGILAVIRSFFAERK